MNRFEETGVVEGKPKEDVLESITSELDSRENVLSEDEDSVGLSRFEDGTKKARIEDLVIDVELGAEVGLGGCDNEDKFEQLPNSELHPGPQ